MRKLGWMLALGLGLGLAQNAHAQKFVNVPVDTGSPNAPIAAPVTANTSFSLSKLFPRRSSMNSITAKPTTGRSIFPARKDLPGNNWLKFFGFNNFKPFTPN